MHRMAPGGNLNHLTQSQYVERFAACKRVFGTFWQIMAPLAKPVS